MLKRTFDLVVSFLVVLVALPLWLLVALAIVLDSHGPVFYRATRVGKDAKLFRMFKFRTMVTDAATRGPGITRDGDPRVTRLGRFLRKLKIDEMPQLINVLKGEMSIVGPRPEDPRYVAYYTPEQRGVFRVRPGMASPAFVKYRHEEEVLASAGEDVEDLYLTRVLPEKLRLDLQYIAQQSLWLDLFTLAQAAVSLFARGEEQTTAAGLGEDPAARNPVRPT
jgi:lipopolysaccharide/colanic/teichoic acid biosynthesis glycosyltransferase